MNTMIIGAGKAGIHLATAFAEEHFNVTVIESDPERARLFDSEIDALFIPGNGYSKEILLSQNIRQIDAFIALTGSDEVNLLCCLQAKQLGAKKTVARVRQSEHSDDLYSFQERLGVDLVLNPDEIVAEEIARTVAYSTSQKLEDFSHRHIRAMTIELPFKSEFIGKAMVDLAFNRKYHVLIGAVIRDDRVFVPKGDFCIEQGDKLFAIGAIENIHRFCTDVLGNVKKVKKVFIVGGSHLTIFLTKYLLKMKIAVKIMDQNEKKCEKLTQLLPKAAILKGDATNEKVLREEQVQHIDLFFALTNEDEQNLFSALMAKQLGAKQVVVKIYQTGIRQEIFNNINIDSIVRPHVSLANRILRFISGGDVQTLFKFADDRISILELELDENSPYQGETLRMISLPENSIVALITRSGKTFVPTGDDTLRAGDTIIMITTKEDLAEEKKKTLWGTLFHLIRKF